MSTTSLILMSVLAWNNPAAGDGMVLEFSATWCGPCQQMSPIVSRFERQGYPIHKFDVEQDRQMAQRYGVERMPTFILVVRGKEVERVVGKMSEEDLYRMFAKIPPKEAALPVAVKTRTPIVRARVADEPMPKKLDMPPPMAASARIRIRDKSGENLGSGTIIDSKIGQTIVLTCGHVFRNLDETSIIEVDVFSKSQPETYVGKLLKFDADSDVGLISIPTDNPLPTCRVAGPGFAIEKGISVDSIGCGNGEKPTQYTIRVTALNRYLGPDNLECTGLPTQGRSGGGLFNKDGLVIGVCTAADHRDRRGLYAGLKSIQELLDKCHLTKLYRTDGVVPEVDPVAQDLEINVAGLKEARPANVITAKAEIQESFLPPASPVLGANTNSPEATLSTADLQDAEQIVKDAVAGAGSAEVVCVIRSIENPRAASRVVVINRASPKFVNYLTDEVHAQQAVKPTTIRTASANAPTRSTAARPYRRTRSLSW